MSNIHQIEQQPKRDQDALIAEEQRVDAASDWIARLDRGLTAHEKNIVTVMVS